MKDWKNVKIINMGFLRAELKKLLISMSSLNEKTQRILEMN